MSFRITLSNGFNREINVNLDNQTFPIAANSSVFADGVRVGDVVTVQANGPIVVRRDFNNESDLVQLVAGNNPSFVISGPGVYGIFPEGTIVPDGDVSVRRVIDTILSNVCDFNNFGGFNDDQCDFFQFQQVMSLLNALLAGKTGPERRAIMNTVILTFVPNQGRTDVTMLEAAIIMRNVPLVARILSLGANPNLTTAGVPLVLQLLGSNFNGVFDDEPLDTQQIINLLIRAGAYYPPNWRFDNWQFDNFFPCYGYGVF